MPLYSVGDLVRPLFVSEKWQMDALGIILEFRRRARGPSDVRVLWNDIPEPRWGLICDIAPVKSADP